MPKPDTLTIARTVRGTPTEAFRAFTHCVALRDWLCDVAQVEARPGGRLYLWWRDGHRAVGTYTGVEPEKRLAFSWDHDGMPGPTAVSVRFASAKAGTRVTVDHQGLGTGPAWAKASEELRSAWSASLENLDSFLADGIDLRQARRPRLGIFIGELNAEIAAKIGSPSKGIRLDGTAPESGAAAAGLQKDDVLVAFDGAPLAHFNDLTPLVSRRKAGDAVTVEFVRGGKRLSADLVLGHFPQPRLPATGAALAKSARGVHRRINTQITKLTRGLSEAGAARPPKKGEWSVKQLIAHLILTERDLQSWAAQMLIDGALGDDLEMRPNVNPRVDALVARLKTLAALRRELAAAQEETAALAENLPRDFVTRRKHLFRRFAGWIVEITPGHFDQEHNEQLALAIKKAAG